MASRFRNPPRTYAEVVASLAKSMPSLGQLGNGYPRPRVSVSVRSPRDSMSECVVNGPFEAAECLDRQWIE